MRQRERRGNRLPLSAGFGEDVEGVAVRLGHHVPKDPRIGSLMDSLARSGAPLPDEFENLDVLTPFGAVYRYDDYDGTESLNRAETRALLKSLRAWVEDRLLLRSVSQPT